MRTLFFFLAVALVSADHYIHYPAGSNDRNRERNDNRNNGNRLFDSQNNNAGGYAWRGSASGKAGYPDEVTYWKGSKVRVMWSNQHGCGDNPNTLCNVVMQVGCEDTMPGLRDGYPMGTLTDSDDDNPGQYYARKFDYNRNNADDTNNRIKGTETIPLPNGFPNSMDSVQYGGTAAETQGLPGTIDGAENVLAFYKGDVRNANGKIGVEYGRHESIEYYQKCRLRERNKGLYNADQQLNNGQGAAATRQNPNGNRSGLECPEERDYYPYWAPNPWKDVAIMIPQGGNGWCDYYRSNSHNVQPIWYCDCDEDCRGRNGNKSPINEIACTNSAGQWVEEKPWKDINPDIGFPECLVHPFSADNHLGNAYQIDPTSGKRDLAEGTPTPAYYDMEIKDWMVGPDAEEGQLCLIRMRYNISTGDYKTHPYLNRQADDTMEFYDWKHNCPEDGQINQDPPQYNEGQMHCSPNITKDTPDGELSVPLYDRPYLTVFEKELGIAINTNQAGRTFQDRTYVFRAANRPDYVPNNAKVFNLGFRGRRGNIVQAYPSTEYFPHPENLIVEKGSWIHYQAHGSDFNAAKNPNNGEGWQYSDRHNIMEVYDQWNVMPKHKSDYEFFTEGEGKDFGHCAAVGPPEESGSEYYGLTLDHCITYEEYLADPGQIPDGQDFDQFIKNCGKMNHCGNKHTIIMEVKADVGEYWYTDTRNNNFSNRNSKGKITVVSSLSAGELAGIIIACIAVIGAGCGLAIYKYKNRAGSTAGSSHMAV